MRRWVALTLTATLLLGGWGPAAEAGSEAAVALGLASFAVFNQLFWPWFTPRVVYYPPVYYANPAPPNVYYYPNQPVAPYPSVAAPYAGPAGTYAVPATPSVVYYAHGRYELHGDGVRTPYVWLWIPNPPPPPAPPSAPAP